MNRRGFALLTVLWAVTLLAVVVGTGLAAAQLDLAAADNRIVLARGGWARDACAEIYLARATPDSAPDSLATVDLGRGTWCRVQVEEPGAKLNVNSADAAALRLVIADDSVAATLVRRRAERDTLRDLREVLPLPGCAADCTTRLVRLLTTRGTGQVNLGTAPPEVLAALPGATPELVELIVWRRAAGRLELLPGELVDALSAETRRRLLTEYQEFARLVSYRPTQLIAHIEGGVRGRAPVARETLTLVPVPGRLAVLRRELE